MIRKGVLAILLFVVAIIVGLSIYLSPDNLSHCGLIPSDIKGCQKADVVIAVSGGDTRARTQQAIDLYSNGWADRLIFSGAALDTSGPSNAEVMKRQAIAQGIPEWVIDTDESSYDTRANARNTASILQKNGDTSAIIVTSGYHMKRTLLEFESLSPNVTFRGHPVSGDQQWSVWWWISPYGWYLALSEIVKILIFKLGVVA